MTEGSAKDDLFSIFKISPDGRERCLRRDPDCGRRPAGPRSSSWTSRARTAARFQSRILEPGTTVTVCWSPDGSRLALNLLDQRTKEGSIALVDLDGSNFRKLPLPPGRWNLLVCDWNTLTPGLKVGAPDETLDLKTPRGRYQALLQEIKKEKPFQPRKYLGRFLEITDSAPNDPAAIDALIWIITFGADGPEFSRAIDLLAQGHAAGRKVGHAALTLTGKAAPAAEGLIRAVVEKNPDQYIKGLACLALGQYLKHQSERVREIREDPDSARAWEAIFVEEGSGKESFARFRGRDPDAMMKEADAIFERIGKEFGGLSSQGDRLSKAAFTELVKDANAELYEMRNLCIGKPAPEIAGQDVDGKLFKLSDYRGKVVVVTFWATWCGSCLAMNESERSLVKRMQGKPFALLGVNGDEDRDKLKEWMKKEDITWRSWWDGGGSANTPGPIARQFNVHGWPTIYILDHRSVIRHKFLGSTQRLDAAINTLVEAVENGGNVSRIHRPGS